MTPADVSAGQCSRVPGFDAQVILGTDGWACVAACALAAASAPLAVIPGELEGAGA